MPNFKLVSDFKPTGDQPDAIDSLAEGLERGNAKQILLGVTGSGKTFTMANIIEHWQRPTLVLAPNRTLAAQLCSEFKEFFPENAVEYFVSYYDYYQPEAYIPRTDTYIAKDADINEEIDKLRHAATRALFERKDVVIVASVSCIYGLGEPEEYQSFVLKFKRGQSLPRARIMRKLVDMQYERNDNNLVRGKFRLRGDSLTLLPAYDEIAVRIDFFGDEVERIIEIDPLTGELLSERDELDIYPAKHFVTSKDKLDLAIEDIEAELEERLAELREAGRILEASRLEERTRYDLESLREAGYCSGIENYSRHLARRGPGSTPWTLLDYFPDEWLLFIDESHIAVPQVRGMYHGDVARKQTLVDFGFRLPSALDNRPLSMTEFEEHLDRVIFVSATPGPYEYEYSEQTVEQIIRPTGLIDPSVEVKPTRGQIDDLLEQVKQRVDRKERVLVTTLTKKMAEDLADYLQEMGVRTHYLHSEIDTLERVEILRDLRLGVYDVVVGINLLREGLDLPEVSLVCILDADKEGYLRSGGSLIQTIGRAARHVNGHVIMYADTITDSMRTALNETERRRGIQMAYNNSHGISPVGIQKAIRDITDRLRKVAEEQATYSVDGGLPKEQLTRMVMDLEKQMKQAAKSLEFEKAAMLRDQVIELRKALVSDTDSLKELAAVAGQEGVQPFTDTGVAGGRRMRGVSYRPDRRGARYRR
jgi:excinuclease ABC subunit B